jgi:YD repeat-containing protein
MNCPPASDEGDQLTATSQGSASFAYDAFGRRVAKTVAGTSRNYLWDGGDITQELAGTQVAANTITGTGIDDVLWRREEPLSGGSAVSRSYLTDALGSTVGMTDVHLSRPDRPGGRSQRLRLRRDGTHRVP